MKPKIGFIGTTMSGFDAVLDVEEVRDMSQYSKVIAVMCKRIEPFTEVINFGIAGNEEEAIQKRDLIVREECDALILWPFNYTLDVVALKLAAGHKTPIILLNTMIRSIIYADEDFGKVMENNANACLPTMTNVFLKNHIPYELVSGPIDDRLYENLHFLAQSVGVARLLRHSRIGTIGYSYPGISAISVDEATVTGHFGVTLVPISTREIAKEFEAVSKDLVQRTAKQVIQTCKVMGISSEELEASICVSPAMEKLVEKYRLNALAQLCQLLIIDPGIGIAPCYANTVLTGRRIPVTCECDIPTAIAMLILQEFSRDVLFLEFYTHDFEKGVAMFSHCGQGNLNLAKENSPVNIKSHPCYPGKRGRGISYEYLTKEGTVTYACLTYLDGKWRMVAGLGESVNFSQRPTSTIQMYFKYKGQNYDESYRRFCDLGGTHHLAVGFGDHLTELKTTCRFLDVEFKTPDE